MFDALFSGFLDDDFDQAVEIHAGEVIEANALERWRGRQKRDRECVS